MTVGYMGETVAVQPYRIWQSIVEERQKEGQHLVSREFMRKRYLMAGYGPEKAKKWIDLYVKEFAIEEKHGLIRLG